MVRTFEFVLHFIRRDTVTVSPNQIIIIFILIIKLMSMRLGILVRHAVCYQIGIVWNVFIIL